jgi:hypothetical protein
MTSSEGLLVAGLLILIAGSAAGIYFSLRKDELQPADPSPHFQCEACRHEFVVDRKAIPAEAFDKAGLDPNLVRLDCPQCKQRGSAVRMIRCPACGEHYVSESARGGQGAPSGQVARDVCPSCGVDRLEWYRRHRKK